MQPTGERQIGTTLSEIRADHRCRYEWVARRIGEGDRMFDAGCGTGYGSGILADRAQSVLAIDSDPPTIAFARETWQRDNLRFETGNLHFLDLGDSTFDKVVAFEVVEHLIDPGLFLDLLWVHMAAGATLFISSPNEDAIAHTVELNPYHVRHLTMDQLGELISRAGFKITGRFAQDSDEIAEGTEGRTIILMGERLSERPALVDQGVMADRLRATLTAAEREMVLRSNTIRKLQKDMRSAAKSSGLGREVAHLRASEAAVVAELIHAERVAANRGTDLSRSKAELEEAHRALDILHDRLAEANRVLDILRDHLAKANAVMDVHGRAQRQQNDRIAELKKNLEQAKNSERKLLADRKKRLSVFDPKRPTVKSVLRVLLRRNLLISTILKAPGYTLVDLYEGVARRVRRSR